MKTLIKAFATFKLIQLIIAIALLYGFYKACPQPLDFMFQSLKHIK